MTGALVFWICAQALWGMPRYWKRGWIGWVPTWVLVAGSGWMDTSASVVGVLGSRATPSWQGAWLTEMVVQRAGVSSETDVIERWMVLQRALAGDSRRVRNASGSKRAAWQNVYFPVIVRAAQDAGADLDNRPRLLRALMEAWIRTPEKVVANMPAGATIVLDGGRVPKIGFVSVTPVLPGSSTAILGRRGETLEFDRVKIGAVPSDSEFLEFEVRGLIGPDTPRPERWRVRVRKAVTTCREIDEVANAVRTPDIRSLPGDAPPTVTIDGRTLAVQLHTGKGGSDSALARLLRFNPELTIGVRLVVLKDGRPLAETKQWWRFTDLWPNFSDSYMAQASQPYIGTLELTVLDAAAFQMSPGARWTLRATGESSVALYDPELSRWWDGQIEESLDVRDRWRMSLP